MLVKKFNQDLFLNLCKCTQAYATGGKVDCDFYSILEFAHKLRVSKDTIRRAIKNGRISAFRVGSGKGAFRIPHSEINRMSTIELKIVINNLIDSGEWKSL